MSKGSATSPVAPPTSWGLTPGLHRAPFQARRQRAGPVTAPLPAQGPPTLRTPCRLWLGLWGPNKSKGWGRADLRPDPSPCTRHSPGTQPLGWGVGWWVLERLGSRKGLEGSGRAEDLGSAPLAWLGPLRADGAASSRSFLSLSQPSQSLSSRGTPLGLSSGRPPAGWGPGHGLPLARLLSSAKRGAGLHLLALTCAPVWEGGPGAEPRPVRSGQVQARPELPPDLKPGGLVSGRGACWGPWGRGCGHPCSDTVGASQGAHQ